MLTGQPSFVLQEFASESVDLYDDVIAGTTSTNGDVNPAPGPGTNSVSSEPTPNHTPYNATNGPPSNIPIKRFQLYVGNLTWVRNESINQMSRFIIFIVIFFFLVDQ